MKCSEVMTDNPVCCLPGDLVSQAARVMRREHVGPVPVISDEQTRELIGIVTDRDLAIKVVAESRDSNKTTVGEVMTNTIIACREDDDMSSAIAAMEEHQIRRIPVIDQGGRIVGIISQADVATRVHEPKRTAEMVEEISRGAYA
ncbi:MAG TPA: CBS domain-containing protein [Pyrinomonadaceae bacterium]